MCFSEWERRVKFGLHSATDAWRIGHEGSWVCGKENWASPGWWPLAFWHSSHTGWCDPVSCFMAAELFLPSRPEGPDKQMDWGCFGSRQQSVWDWTFKWKSKCTVRMEGVTTMGLHIYTIFHVGKILLDRRNYFKEVISETYELFLLSGVVHPSGGCGFGCF